MARTGRVKCETGTYMVRQQSGGSRPLFQSDEDRCRFLAILDRAQAAFGFRLKGFCLSSDSGYRLLMDVDGGDISKIMKSINISYAMYARCDGKLFRDRYISTLVETPEQLAEAEECLRASGADPWTRCPQQPREEQAEPAIHLHFAESEADELPEACLKTPGDALARLTAIGNAEGVSVQTLLKDKDRRNELIRLFRRRSTLSLKELGAVFGGLTESSVSKIIKVE